MKRYHFRGEGSDKDLSLLTGRGKLSRNTLEIQKMKNFRNGSARKMRKRKWSFYRRRW
jgi:hypothetical protein